MKSRLWSVPDRRRLLLLAGVVGLLIRPGALPAADRTVLGELYSAYY